MTNIKIKLKATAKLPGGGDGGVVGVGVSGSSVVGTIHKKRCMI